MKFEDSIIKISDSTNEPDFKDLFSENRLYTFLVGAGISMDSPSFVPSARMFVSELFKHYAPEGEIDKLLISRTKSANGSSLRFIIP